VSAELTATARSATALAAEMAPWIARHQGAVVVIKYGGNAMTDDSLKRAFAEDVVTLLGAGLRPVVVHGGGPQITAMLERLGVSSEFRGGYRVTTPEAMDVVRMVLTGKVQREVVDLVNTHGPHAVGLSGEDAHLFTAVQHYAEVDGEKIDVGLVGDITDVSPELVRRLVDDGLVPVVSSIGRGAGGEIYNVNADIAASALAVALRADKLVVLTDVAGLYADWPNSKEVISEISAAELEALLPSLASGMIPKMQACLRAVRGGVERAHVLDGRVPHALVAEVFTDSGVGTMVTP
jgi:acetylglutamate kinase